MSKLIVQQGISNDVLGIGNVLEEGVAKCWQRMLVYWILPSSNYLDCTWIIIKMTMVVAYSIYSMSLVITVVMAQKGAVLKKTILSVLNVFLTSIENSNFILRICSKLLFVHWMDMKWSHIVIDEYFQFNKNWCKEEERDNAIMVCLIYRNRYGAIFEWVSIDNDLECLLNNKYSTIIFCKYWDVRRMHIHTFKPSPQTK